MSSRLNLTLLLPAAVSCAWRHLPALPDLQLLRGAAKLDPRRLQQQPAEGGT